MIHVRRLGRGLAFLGLVTIVTAAVELFPVVVIPILLVATAYFVGLVTSNE